MKRVLTVLAILIYGIAAIFPSKVVSITNRNHHRVYTKVNIYSNLAEIIQSVDKLPLEFSADDWSNIRYDSITLVGSNVNITRQTITEKKKTLNNAHVYVCLPSSSATEVQYLEAIMIDESRNLVKTIDKNISKNPIYFTVSADHILYVDEPPQSKYYVDFTYHTTDLAYVSYLRSNLNWKTSYQLHLFEESVEPKFIVMADIRNDGKSNVNIDHAELLGGDINLQMAEKQLMRFENQIYADKADSSSAYSFPSVAEGREVAGVYVFAINHSFSIEAKTNYLLPMFRPHVSVERFGLIEKTAFYGTGRSTGKFQRMYRLSSDRFLSRGNCMIREFDYLVGETSLPDLAAKDKHEFSIGDDSDIIYKENVTLVSSQTYNETTQPGNKIEQRTQSVYDVNVVLTNFKKNRSVNIVYRQATNSRWMKLKTSKGGMIQDDTMLECKTILAANEEKFLSYNVEIIR